MSTLINDPSVALARLNVFDDPVPWNQVRLAGTLILALVTKFNGLKIEDAWKMQKSKSASGAVMSFAGTDPVGGESGFSITFRAVGRLEFDQAYDVFDALKPVPVHGFSGGGGGTSTKAVTYAAGSPPKPDDASAEQLLAQAQAALGSLNSPTPAASSAAPAATAQAASTPQPSPGPRPPTVPIECGWLAFLGVFAVARKSFEWSTIENDKYEFTIGFVHQNPPKPAGSGAMSAPSAAASTAYVAQTPSQLAASGASGV